MRTGKRMSILLLFCILNLMVFSQQNCKVLMPEISGEYIGKCKKGLAHGKGKAVGRDTYIGQFKNGLPNGKGTYTWSSGSTFNGTWKNGKKNGEGELKTIQNGISSTKIGIWENDEYIGPKTEKPKALHQIGVERYSFIRLSNGNRVSVDIMRSGVRNTDIEALTMFGSSGNLITTGSTTGYENIMFPFNGKIRYKSWNKLHTSQFDVIFEFEINSPGDWQLIIHN